MQALMNFGPSPQEFKPHRGAPTSHGCNKTQAIQEALGKSIVARRYPVEGTAVTEAELCAHFGVARGSLREAIRGLRSKGLVESAPRLGLWVQPERCWNLLDPDILRWLLDRRPSHELLTELIEIRLAVQPRAAVVAALNVKQGFGEAVVLASNRILEGLQDFEITSGITWFQSGILRATGNRFFEQMIDVVCTSIRMTNRYLIKTARVEAEELQMLTAIARDMLDGDAERAEKDMRRLLNFELNMVELATAEQRSWVALPAI